MLDLFMVLLITAALIGWWQLMQGRQKARAAAGMVCANHGLQLLDDTVSLNSISWERVAGGMRIKLHYRFEFTSNGAARRNGMATLGSVLTISLDLEEGCLIEEVQPR